jgi:hypothetical protein
MGTRAEYTASLNTSEISQVAALPILPVVPGSGRPVDALGNGYMGY